MRIAQPRMEPGPWLLSPSPRHQHIAGGVFFAVKLPPARKPKKEAFTELEIRQIEKAAEAGDIWAGTIMILLYTGMRVGELVTLTPFQVDLDARIITGGIKTDAGRDRPMPVHSRILSYVVFGIIEIQRTAAKMSQEKLKIKKA